MIRQPEILACLVELGACGVSIRWVRAQSETATLAQLWRSCPRGEWLLWLADYVPATAGAREACAREIALTVAHLWDAPDVVLEWLRTGDPRLRQEAAAVAREAWVAAAAAAAAAARAEAARVTLAAADWWARATVAWAEVATWAAAGAEAHRKHATIVRRHISWRDVEEVFRCDD